ncbi:MAG: DUF2298 domain-containing protein [Anaerolineae bacterium]
MVESNPTQSNPSEVTWNQIADWFLNAWRQRRELVKHPRFHWVLLALILLLAGVLRLTGLNWDEGQHLHPDERFLTMVETSLNWPSSLGQYFDTANNPLNPYNTGYGSYVYGLFPLMLTKVAGQITGFTGYGEINLVGRVLSALMDMGCVFFVYLIGRRLYSLRVGLLGAFFLSVSVLSIQNSHFFTVDASTTFFVTMALYFAVRVAQGEGIGSVIGLGVAFGMAVSCKISVLTFLLIIALAFSLRLVRHWRSERDTPDAAPLPEPPRRNRWRLIVRIEDANGSVPSLASHIFQPALRAILAMGLVVLVAFLVFRIVQPQAFTGPGFFGLAPNIKWLGDMGMISKLVSGQIDYPPSHQWTTREPIWYAWKNLVLWGLGVPLGLAVWFAWGVMGWLLVRKHRWEHLLPWVWMTLTFFYQSVQFVKTVRYMLPIYPTMALMAAFGLVWLYELAKRRQETHLAQDWRRHLPKAALATGCLVAIGTLGWALAFTSIYTRPVSRLTASRWIYANLPPGAGITWEEWDDPLPLNIDGRSAGNTFNQIKTGPYGEDTPEKRNMLYGWLQEADYILLSSNRLYESIPRLPLRYPMTTRYYEALFSGELGFDLLQTFTSRPTLFGIEIVDDYADETFTVYDHPKVLLFKKNDSFSLSKLYILFDNYDLERVVRMMPKDVGRAPNALLLDSATWIKQQTAGTWTSIFATNGLVSRIPTPIWLLLIYLLGFIGFPYVFLACRSLRDGGYALSKLVGVLLLGFLAWLIPSLRLATFSRGLIALLLVALLLGALFIAWRQRTSLMAFLRERWRQIVLIEVIFMVLFMAFWFIRRANPDLWHPAMGGEKPMDLAYLSAILKSEYFPPYDPWFAGGYINYYYFGLALAATLIKFTGIVPTVAYNLVLPTWFAFTGIAAFGLVYNLTRGDIERRWFNRPLIFGLLATFLVAVAGNLGEIVLLVKGWISLGSSAFTSAIPGLESLVRLFGGLWVNIFNGQTLPFRPEWWYWNATRVMQNGEINEFPFFTFLYGDLHAHLLALPYTLLALGLALSLVLRTREDADAPDTPRLWNTIRRWPWSTLGLLALTLGLLWCANTWDYPTYTLITCAFLGLGLYLARGKLDKTLFISWLVQAVVMLGLSYLLYYPFHAHYGAAYTSVELWTQERTSLGAFLIIQALPLFILYSLIGKAVLGRQAQGAVARALRILLPHRRWARSRQRYVDLVRLPSLGYQAAWVGLGFLCAVLLFCLLFNAWVPLLVLPLLVMCVALVLRRESSSIQRIIGLLAVSGAILVIAVEFIVLRGDIGRMNTVFKFYLQAWVLWGSASALALSEIYVGQRAWPVLRRRWWNVVLTLLLVSVASYPILATAGKARDRWQTPAPQGLDGLAYMWQASLEDQGHPITLANDAKAILWLQQNVTGSPVVAEASVPPYRWGSRISIYTGLPTIIGWDWHQKQQRAAYSSQVIDWRIEDLRTLYSGRDVTAAWRIIARYNVRYIYVGELEAAYYDAAGLGKFNVMVGSGMEVAYQDGPVTIYRVLDHD